MLLCSQKVLKPLIIYAVRGNFTAMAVVVSIMVVLFVVLPLLCCCLLVRHEGSISLLS